MGKKKILIIDDEKDILDITEKKLKENNYIVTAISRAKDALDTASFFKPDLIISDIVMPDMDGYSLVSCLRQNKSLKNIPVIFFTGKELNPEGILNRISELGAIGFINKPCDFNELLTKIKEVIG